MMDQEAFSRKDFRRDHIPTPSLRGFFGRLTERSFGELHIWDKEIINYVAGMLTRFARTDQLYRIKSSEEKRLETVVEMLLEIAPSEEKPYILDREREVRQHIGDYTLFMIGIFREYVEGQSIVEYYVTEGKRSYRHVSELDRMLFRSGAGLFEELSKQFEYLGGALNYMKKVYFRPEMHQGPYQGLIEQLSGW